MATFKLAIQGFSETLTVQRFRGTEGLSKLFRFDIEAAVDASDFHRRADLIGTSAVFGFAGDASDARQIHGVIARATRTDRTTPQGRVYRFRLVPHLWKRKHHLTSRVFQDKTVPEIVAELLANRDVSIKALARTSSTSDTAGKTSAVDRTWQALRTTLGEDYPKREYAVQYQESDYHFLKRILAEEGIYFYFERTADPTVPSYDDSRAGKLDDQSEFDQLDVLVLADGAGYPSAFAATPVLTDDATGLQKGGDVIASFEPASRFKSDAVLLRDYDFERPQQVLEAESARDPAESAIGSLQPFERKDEDIRRARFHRVYEHRGEYLVPDVSEARTRRQLEQQRRNALRGTGRSAARHLMPGYRFKVQLGISHNLPELTEDLVVTRIEHRGHIPEHSALTDTVYTNEIEFVPASVPYRPKRPKPRTIQVTESATVCGKEDGSVYTDEYGRIRVQFHWDLEGGMNEQSTTWLRVVQGWSGAAYGLQFIPRVGMEVMVSFLGGDPDSPVVLGAVYNRTHPHPFRLANPDDALGHGQPLRSGIRTQSYPGGAGFNELSFEDTSGAEQLFLHAARDLDTVVKRNQSTQIARSQIVDVGENQTNRVVENRAESIGGRSERTVGGDETNAVKGNRSTAIGGVEALSVERERRVKIALDDRADVGGRSESYVRDDVALRTDGNHVTLVGTAAAPRGYALRVEGTTDVSSADLLEVVSLKGIRLRCGNSVIEVMPDSIDLLSPSVNIRSANAEIVTKEDSVNVFAKAQAKFDVGTSLGVWCELGASFEVGAVLQGKGDQIKFDKPSSDGDSKKRDEKPPTIIELADPDGKPLAYRRFVLVFKNGAERSFVLDADGRCEIRGLEEDGVTIRFPELVDPCS
ncbi:MAG: type VI secretion system tip protein TssI/VgrG [Polyangiaceae bacterium]